MNKTIMLSLILLFAFCSAFAQALPERLRPLSSITTVTDYTAAGRFASVANSPSLLSLPLDDSQTAAVAVENPADTAARAANFFNNPYQYPQGLLCGASSGTVFWFDTATETFTPLFTLDSSIQSLSMTADGRLVAVVCDSGAYLWERSMPASLRFIQGGALNGGRGSISYMQLNASGSAMIVSVTESNEHESWYYQYLLDTATLRAQRKLGFYSGFGFTPDGRNLVNQGYDYRRRDAKDHPYDSFTVCDFQGKPLARFSAEGEWRDQYDRRDYKDTLNNLDSPLQAWFSMGWSEFGLSIITSRRDYQESGQVFYKYDMVPGSGTGPDMTSYYPSEAPVTNNYALGFSYTRSDDYQYSIFSRSSAEGGTAWSRKVAVTDIGQMQYGYIDQDQNVLALPLSKPRPIANGQSITSVQYIRLIDWTTGRALRADLPLGTGSVRRVRFIAPNLEYLLLETGSNERYALYWLNSGVYRSWDGGTTYLGEGIPSFKPSFGGSVRYTLGNKDYYLPAASGQTGAAVMLAVHPKQHTIAVVDEAGQCFLRELATGRTLYSTKLAVIEGMVSSADNLPDASILSAISARAPLASFAATPLGIQSVAISTAPGFREQEQ